MLRRLSTRRGTMTAVMDRRKSLGLAKSSNRPETTFKEEDELQDDIYGGRSRNVRNMYKYLLLRAKHLYHYYQTNIIHLISLFIKGFSNLGFVKELDEVGDEEIDSVLEGK